MKHINVAMLQSRGACLSQLQLFYELFPDGVTFTSEEDAVRQCVAVAELFDWSWGSNQLLPYDARVAYGEAATSAWTAFEKAMFEARVAFEEALATGRAAYKAKALAAYEEAIASGTWREWSFDPDNREANAYQDKAWEDYEEASDEACQVCSEAKAKAFAKAFWNVKEEEE